MKKLALALAAIMITLCGCTGIETAEPTATPAGNTPVPAEEAAFATPEPETPAPEATEPASEPTPEPLTDEVDYDWDLAQYGREDLWITEYTCEKEGGTVLLSAVTNPTGETVSVFGCLTVRDANGEVCRTVAADGGIVGNGRTTLLIFEEGELPEHAEIDVRYAARVEEGEAFAAEDLREVTEESEEGLTISFTNEGTAEVGEYTCYVVFWNNAEELTDYVPIVIATADDPLKPGETRSGSVTFPEDWLAYGLYYTGSGVAAE